MARIPSRGFFGDGGCGAFHVPLVDSDFEIARLAHLDAPRLLRLEFSIRVFKQGFDILSFTCSGSEKNQHLIDARDKSSQVSALQTPLDQSGNGGERNGNPWLGGILFLVPRARPGSAGEICITGGGGARTPAVEFRLATRCEVCYLGFPQSGCCQRSECETNDRDGGNFQLGRDFMDK